MCSHLTVLFIVLTGPDSFRAQPDPMEWIQVSKDRHGFSLERSGRPFHPWGFNYDHDERDRLLEDYWETEWTKVAEDFREMKELGANVVRIHLQLARFMTAPDRPNDRSLDRLARLIALAEQLNIYLDVTGLGCYHKQDVPPWYDQMSEAQRWEVQTKFWETIAQRCAESPAIFCYDLMNEPVVPGGRRQPGQWLAPPLGDKYFVQFVTLDSAGRPRPTIARQWVQQLAAAIRRHDRRHLVTVGLVDWSLNRPGLTSGFEPREIAPDLDFISVHIYPKTGEIERSLDTLRGFAVGKPVVIEETFPLACKMPDFERFIRESARTAAGWIGFYWGRTPQECRRSQAIRDALMLGWLDFFADPSRHPFGKGIATPPHE